MFYNIDMSFEKTKKFVIELAKKEVLYEIEFSKKQQHGDLSKQEQFCLDLFYFCKDLYQMPTLDPDSYSLIKLGVREIENGMYYIDQEFGRGHFCNANAMIADVYCEEKECHSTAYSFVSNYEGKVSIKSGIINPYHLEYGIMHSICEFEKGGITYVFDGANYLIMEKDLYYKLYNFQCVQEISREKLLKDIVNISKAREKGSLKQRNLGYSMAQDLSAVEKHFEGFGFMLYLYDRKASISQKGSTVQINQRNKRAMEELQKSVQSVEMQEFGAKSYDEEILLKSNK